MFTNKQRSIFLTVTLTLLILFLRFSEALAEKQNQVAECGSIIKVEGEEVYYIKSSIRSSRLRRSFYNGVENKYYGGYGSPNQYFDPYFMYGFHNNPLYSQTRLPRTKNCIWKFVTDQKDCKLTVNFEKYQPGDINCRHQYLLLADEERETQICGYAHFESEFESSGNELIIKHFYQAGSLSSKFEGAVSCAKTREYSHVSEYGSISGEIYTGDENSPSPYDGTTIYSPNIYYSEVSEEVNEKPYLQDTVEQKSVEETYVGIYPISRENLYEKEVIESSEEYENKKPEISIQPVYENYDEPNYSAVEDYDDLTYENSKPEKYEESISNKEYEETNVEKNYNDKYEEEDLNTKAKYIDENAKSNQPELEKYEEVNNPKNKEYEETKVYPQIEKYEELEKPEKYAIEETKSSKYDANPVNNEDVNNGPQQQKY